MAQLIGDMTLSLTTLGRRASEGAMRRQRATSSESAGGAAGRDSGRQDTRRQRVAVDSTESSGPTNAGSRSLETVDAAGAGRPPLGLHNRAE
jgi:hypothetical protein